MKTVIDILFLRRHFWHRVKLNELSELYISLTLRTLGLGMIGIFIPVYFYQEGYSLETIGLFFAAVYILRLLLDPLTGKLVARFGPKHIIRFSYPVEVLFLISVIAAGNYIIPLWSVVFTTAISVSLFMVPFHVDFSSVENVKHAGQQLGLLTILEKAASALGPLAGGLIATMYGFEVAIIAALAVTLLAAIPLYATGEMRGHRAYKYKFSLKHYMNIHKDIPPYIGRAADVGTSTLFWPLFIVLVVFTEQVYSGLGFITALGTGVTIIFAHLIGRLVDNKKGRELLRAGAWSTALVNILRPLVRTVPGAVGLSIPSEALNTAYRLPFMKGYYARSDVSPDGRVAYIVSSIAIYHVTRAALFTLFVVMLMFFDDVTALSIMMVITGLMTLLVLKEKFSALDR